MIRFKYAFFLIVFIVILFFLGAIISSFIIEDIILPDDFLFYEHTPLCSVLFALVLIIPTVIVSLYIIFLIARKTGDNIDELFDQFGIHFTDRKVKIYLLVLLPIWIMISYFVLTSLTYVTTDEIVVLRPWNIYGEHYNYNEVEKIEAGFGNESFALYEHKKEGSFYYKITLDGTDKVFCAPSVNKNIEEYKDTYIELEIFDKALTELGIAKYSSKDGYENYVVDEYDDYYLERFLRIIENVG